MVFAHDGGNKPIKQCNGKELASISLWQNMQNINCNNEKLHRGELGFKGIRQSRSIWPLGDQILSYYWQSMPVHNGPAVN